MRKVIFLDRDGTLNVDRGYLFRISDWEFCSGAIDALHLFRRADFAVAVVSNQSGVARGYYSRDDVDALHRWVAEQLASQGPRVDHFAYCPHGPDDHCACRKPGTLLARQIEAESGWTIDYSESWTIGDKESDVRFGVALGMRTALLRSRYWNERELLVTPDFIGDSLLEAARFIVPNSSPPPAT